MLATTASPEADLLTFDNLRLSQPRPAHPHRTATARAINCTGGAINCTCDLPDAVRAYADAATSGATKRAYGFDLAHFRAWGGIVPASPEMIAAYLAEHAAALSAQTLARRLSALSRAHTTKGYDSRTSAPLVLAVLRGIRRSHHNAPQEAKPLLASDLRRIVNRLTVNHRDLRDRALLLIGFAGGLRRSELVALNVADLAIHDDRIVATIRRSKTDPLGHGRSAIIPASTSNACPVRTLSDWLTAAGIAKGPVFRPIDRHGNIASNRLTGHAASEIVKKRVAEAGINPTGYSGHSLRAGYATSAAMAGHSSYEIRQQTGHRSEEMVARYVRLSRELGDKKGRSLL